MNKLCVGMAARFVDDKLQNLLVDIFYENRKFFKEKNCSLQLAGSGIKYIDIKKKIKLYNLEDVIILNGNLNEKEIINWFKKIDIYVHFSKDETTSTSILQAMSIGIPIIASNVAGNKMLLKSKNNKRNILLVDNDKSKIFNLLKNCILQKKKNERTIQICKKDGNKIFFTYSNV
jgi:glycosyltransferase involved in cell wall biosynthesis